MDNSIKVKINYHPVNFMQIALWIMILFAVPCFWQSSCGASGGQRQAGCGAGRGRLVDFYCMLVCGWRLFSLPELKFLW